MNFATKVLLATQSAQALNIIYRSEAEKHLYLGDPKDWPAFFPYPKKVKKGANCSATLIEPNIAVTAAHCFVPHSEDNHYPPFEV